MNDEFTLANLSEILRDMHDDFNFYRQLRPLEQRLAEPKRKNMGSEETDELNETLAKLTDLVELQHRIIELLVKWAKDPNGDMRETMFAEIDDIEKKMQETIYK